MKIKFGSLVVDGRGKIGGHVAAKNKAGNYLRTKTTPTNPQTTAQTSARQLFAAISQGWSGLTQAQRDAWDEAVSDWSKTDIFGDIKNPIGKNLYQRLNNQAQSAGYTAVTDVPAKLEMVEGVVTAGVLDTSLTTLTLTGAYSGSDARVMLFATAPLSAGTKFVKNKLRYIYNEVAENFTSGDAYENYTDKFGAPSAGANVYLGVKYVLPNGQASPMQILKATVS